MVIVDIWCWKVSLHSNMLDRVKNLASTSSWTNLKGADQVSCVHLKAGSKSEWTCYGGIQLGVKSHLWAIAGTPFSGAELLRPFLTPQASFRWSKKAQTLLLKNEEDWSGKFSSLRCVSCLTRSYWTRLLYLELNDHDCTSSFQTSLEVRDLNDHDCTSDTPYSG